jgi:hypothetical protein
MVADSLANNRSIQRNHQDKLKSKLETLGEKLDQTTKIQETLITRVQDVVESGMSRGQNALMTIQSDLKFGWLRKLGTELKCMVFQIFEISGTTLNAVQRIEQRLPSKSEMSLIRTFTLEDALGRTTPVDMLFVSSWDALDGMLEACFRNYPGHGKVAKKDYVFQDQKTNREVKRSIPWSGAFTPGQHVSMALIFWQHPQDSAHVSCPGCNAVLKAERTTIISW